MFRIMYGTGVLASDSFSSQEHSQDFRKGGGGGKPVSVYYYNARFAREKCNP